MSYNNAGTWDHSFTGPDGRTTVGAAAIPHAIANGAAYVVWRDMVGSWYSVKPDGGFNNDTTIELVWCSDNSQLDDA